jgi:hypothetical protein
MTKISSAQLASALIEKGGEGSKGGHVIGHTSSGNPIYGSPAEKRKKEDREANAKAAKKFSGSKPSKWDEAEAKAKKKSDEEWENKRTLAGSMYAAKEKHRLGKVKKRGHQNKRAR